MDGLSTEEQLILLRDMTKKLNVLHEAQVVQLKYWFFMLYSEIEKFEIVFDPDRSTLTYRIFAIKNIEEHVNNKNFDTLEKYIKFLLGERFRLRVEHATEEGR